MGLLLSGFADEAAKGLREQIAVHKQCNIPSLEIRLVNDVNIGQMDDRQFVIDTTSLLRPEVKYDIKEAYELVMNELVSKIQK